MSGREITVTFTHARSSKTFVARVGLGLTADMIIKALSSPAHGPFLAPPQVGYVYEVIDEMGKAIPPQMTLDRAGVRDGDMLTIGSNVIGGRIG